MQSTANRRNASKMIKETALAWAVKSTSFTQGNMKSYFRISAFAVFQNRHKSHSLGTLIGENLGIKVGMGGMLLLVNTSYIFTFFVATCLMTNDALVV